MKLLLDEQLSPRIAEALRQRGWDVMSALEVGLDARPDLEVWMRAIAEERVMVTGDTDDFPDLFTQLFHEGIRHPGLVLIGTRTIPTSDFGMLIRALEELMRLNPDLTDQYAFLQRPRDP